MGLTYNLLIDYWFEKTNIYLRNKLNYNSLIADLWNKYMRNDENIKKNGKNIGIRQKKVMRWTCKMFFTSHNRPVYASLPVGGSGFRSPRSFRYASLTRLTPLTVCWPWKCYAFPYSGRQNVVNRRNVMRHLRQTFSKKLYGNT
jgi:hypothetical protein